ncbi:tyrosine--tRNA ligase [Candidatus Uhrbacteria bacterium]|nr:tyrosine--tRNA ligase [Candidatus Uhrbacteria bacterium]
MVTDQHKIDALLSRRVAEAVVEKDLRAKLAAGKRLRIKLGVDPTAPDLHLGHSIALKKLREFQELGHQVVLIIGDYTSLIGDPTGKSKTRPTLSEKEVKANAKTYIAQVGKILDLKKTEIRWNSEWFAKMRFRDVIALAGKFTVARMIERDDFAERLKGGADIHMHELLYPMMQAYDSIMIEADVELGGTDQRFNILAGRDLQRKMGLAEQSALFLGPTLVGTDGVNKMSKSLGNYIGITEAPEMMYGKVMSVPDAAMWDYFLLTTDLPEKEVYALREACEQASMNPRDAKARLAREIVTMYHSAAKADAAERQFVATFREKQAPADMAEVALKRGSHLLGDVLLAAKLVASKGEARRLIEQGGVKVNGEVVADAVVIIEVGDQPIVIQKGKRHFVRLVTK